MEKAGIWQDSRKVLRRIILTNEDFRMTKIQAQSLIKLKQDFRESESPARAAQGNYGGRDSPEISKYGRL